MKKIIFLIVCLLIASIPLSAGQYYATDCFDKDVDTENPLFDASYVELYYDATKVEGSRWLYDYCENSDPKQKKIIEQECIKSQGYLAIDSVEKTCPDGYICSLGACKPEDSYYSCVELPTKDAYGNIFTDRKDGIYRSGDIEFKTPAEDKKIKVNWDYCEDGYLFEYYCNGDYIESEKITCPEGSKCIYDACVKEEKANELFSCSESQDDVPPDPHIKGEITELIRNGIARTPKELEDIQDYCSDTYSLWEQYCKDDDLMWWYVECRQDEYCNKYRGVCEPANCFDQDGLNLNTPGDAYLYNPHGGRDEKEIIEETRLKDTCLSKDKLLEATCINGRPETVEKSCENNLPCIKDHCLTQQEYDDGFKALYSCDEMNPLDKEADIHIKGDISVMEGEVNVNTIIPDICRNDGKLIEFSCDNWFKKEEIKDCLEGEVCAGGRCLKEDKFMQAYSCNGHGKEEIDYSKQSSVYGLDNGESFSYSDYCEGETAYKYACEDNNRFWLRESKHCDDGTYCYDGTCLKPLDKAPVCDDGQSLCGKVCDGQDNRCEDTEGKLIGYSPRMIYTPPKEGVCSNGICLDMGCEAHIIENFEYCNGYVKDNDCDGIKDSEDNCPQDCTKNLISSLTENTELDDFGCPKLPAELEKDRCMHLKGSGDNVNIVIVPCGFGNDKQSIYDYWAKQIADSFDSVIPFSIEENKRKYSVSYLWDISKRNKIIGTGIDELDACLEDNDGTINLEKIKTIEGCPAENTVMFILAHRAYQGNTIGQAYFGGEGTGTQGIGSCCPANKECCGDMNKYTVNTALHEMGHSFDLGHSTFMLEDNSLKDEQPDFSESQNNYYSPTTYPISKSNTLDRPCPIWDYSQYLEFEDLNKQMMGCFYGYDIANWEYGSRYMYSPLAEISLMSGNRFEYDSLNRREKAIMKYDPVSAKLIDDAIGMGYDKYLNYKYPHKCEDFLKSAVDDEGNLQYTVIDQEDLSYLGPKIGDDGKLEIADVRKCFQRECMDFDSAKKEECCMPLKERSSEEEYKICLESVGG